MTRNVYVGWIVIEPGVEQKICTRAGGGCTGDEVREAFQGRDDVALKRRPDTDPAEVAGFGSTAEGKELFAAFVAGDEDDGTWVLMTAWPI